MTRALRICLTLFGPAPIALASLGIVLFWREVFTHLHDLQVWFSSFSISPRDVFISTLASYVVAGLPSIFYMIVIELAISEGTDPRSWKFVVKSSLLGLLSGFGIGLVFHELGFVGWFILLGTWVGFVVGLLIKIMPNKISLRRHKRRQPREIVHD